MRPDSRHIRSIEVISNTHWDREFRRSFEKTRRRLLTMMDTTLDILEADPEYHSFTLDGHAILVDDYLEMRPERREQVERFVRAGRLALGPWYTLAEEFSIGQEPLVRNFLYGRKTVEAYGGRPGTVAYTPSSWGQTGQLPQILAGFGLDKMMFYRGISHHEADAEWIWAAPDGTQVLASRFGVYARYNWYYQVHRPVTTGRVFGKDYVWGEFDEAPVRVADGLAGEDLAFDLQSPALRYDPGRLEQAILDMVEREGRHFTTPVFLAMHGHDISVAHPYESKIVKDAQALFRGRLEIRHTDLEQAWREIEKHLDRAKLPVLAGERRSYLKEGMWTFLFPGTISARTYLKQRDFAATARLVEYAEPLASLGAVAGLPYPVRYLDRAWRTLLSNHTHDANGGCAPDPVCEDMTARYRQVADIADIVLEDAMAHVAKNLAPAGQGAEAVQFVVYNPLPFARDAVVLADLEMPRGQNAKGVRLEAEGDLSPARQPLSWEKSSSFVDSIWEVPRILESHRVRFHARLSALPALGWRAYRAVAEPAAPRPATSLLTGAQRMENEHLVVELNANGTVDLTCKATGRVYRQANSLLDSGECGNAWKHVAPVRDRICSSTGVSARLQVVESGPLVTVLRAEYVFEVPADCGDGQGRSASLVPLPVSVEYRLEAGARAVGVTLTVENRAGDHWLRACCPTGLGASVSVADTHYDVIERPIAVPDSTGWVEPAFGTHPLQTFAALSDGRDGFAVMPQGLFEFEVFDTPERTIALTLIRACRIKLAVSEEKMTELPDAGVQCPGVQTFRYALAPHAGTWREAGLPRLARALAHPVRALQTGRGKGTLPASFSLFSLDDAEVQVAAVKQAESGRGLVVRLYNPTGGPRAVSLAFGAAVRAARLLRLDESEIGAAEFAGATVRLSLGAKKIVTLGVEIASL